MTVKELIAKLQIRPQNMEVVIPDDSGEFGYRPLEVDEIGVKKLTFHEGTEDGPTAEEKCLVLGEDLSLVDADSLEDAEEE